MTHFTSSSRSPGPTRHKCVFAGLLALILWLPLPFGSGTLWARALVDLWACLLAAGFLFTVLRTRTVVIPQAFRKSGPFLGLLLLLVVWMGLQQIPLPPPLVELLSPRAASMWQASPGISEADWIPLTLDRYASLRDLRTVFSFFILITLILLLVDSTLRLRQLAGTIIIAGGFQAAYGSLMMLSGLEYGFFVRNDTQIGMANGTFLSRNSFASYLYLCLAVGIGYMIGKSASSRSADDWRQRAGRLADTLLSPKAWVRILLCVMVVALVLSRSRMGNTAFFVSLTTAGGLALFLQRRHVTRGMVILFISLILIDTLIVAQWFGIEKVIDRIEQTSVVRDKGRIDVSQDAKRMWKDYLWTGSGSGSFYSVFPAYKSPEVHTFEWHAHNDYFEFGAELGVIGIGILGGLVVYTFVTSIRVQMRRRHPLMRGMGFACTMAIIALAMHSTVDFSLQVPAIGATILVIMTMAQIALWMPVERPTHSKPEEDEELLSEGEPDPINGANASSFSSSMFQDDQRSRH